MLPLSPWSLKLLSYWLASASMWVNGSDVNAWKKSDNASRSRLLCKCLHIILENLHANIKQMIQYNLWTAKEMEMDLMNSLALQSFRSHPQSVFTIKLLLDIQSVIIIIRSKLQVYTYSTMMKTVCNQSGCWIWGSEISSQAIQKFLNF